jgi:hypothetical protein
MESDSSAKNVLSLFASSKLESFDPRSSARAFYQPAPQTLGADDNTPEQHAQEPPRKRRRRQHHAGEWTCAEIKALETYRNLCIRGAEIDDSLRDVLLPNRKNEEVKLQLARLEKTIKERRGSKLAELEKQEGERFKEEEKARLLEMQNDMQRRKRGLDDVLGLHSYAGEHGETSFSFLTETQTHENENPKDALDRVLGLGGVGQPSETDEQRRKREFDEALDLA